MFIRVTSKGYIACHNASSAALSRDWRCNDDGCRESMLGEEELMRVRCVSPFFCLILMDGIRALAFVCFFVCVFWLVVLVCCLVGLCWGFVSVVFGFVFHPFLPHTRVMKLRKVSVKWALDLAPDVRSPVHFVVVSLSLSS